MNFLEGITASEADQQLDELRKKLLEIETLPDPKDRYSMLDVLNATASDMLGDYYDL